MKHLIVHFFLLFPVLALAQECSPAQYQKLLTEAGQATARGQYDLAINKLQSAKTCRPEREEEVSRKILVVFERVNGERQTAIRNADAARRQQERAEAEARRIYANDLAFKSTTALQSGDRTTAFRLAVFARQFVDTSFNININRALIEAFYCEDYADTTNRLVWAAGLFSHFSGVTAVAYSSDGSRLATATSTGEIRIWDFVNRKVKQTFKWNSSDAGPAYFALPGAGSNIMGLGFTPNGKKLVGASATSPIIKVWNLETLGEPSLLNGHTIQVSDIAISPKGRYLASSSMLENMVKVWDMELGQEIITLKFDNVIRVAYSSDGRWLAGAASGSVRIWNTQNTEEFTTINQPGIIGLSFAPDGKSLAISSGKNTHVWDWQEGKIITSLNGHSHAVQCVKFSPNGKWLISGSDDNTIIIWDWKLQKAVSTLYGHTTPVRCAEFSPDGKMLVSGSIDGTLRIWDITNLPEPGSQPAGSAPVGIVHFSQDGHYLYSWSLDNTVRIQSTEGNNTTETFSLGSLNVTCAAFSFDGAQLFTGLTDGTIRLWYLREKKAGRTITLKNPISINSAAFSPDGKMLLLGTLQGEVIYVHLNTGETGTFMEGIHSLIDCIAFSKNGKMIAIGYGREVRIRYVEEQKEILIKTNNSVWDIVFSPDKHKIAISEKNNTVTVWDCLEGKLLRTFKNTYGNIAFSSDGKWLGTTNMGPNRLATIWEVQSGMKILQFKGETIAGKCIAFSPHNQFAMGTYEGNVKLWELHPKAITEKAFSRFPLAAITPQQLDNYFLNDLLDLRPQNESLLLATRETGQIAAFADLYAQKIAETGFPVKTDYERALRLYQACLSHGVDNVYFQQKIDSLKNIWVEKTGEK